MFVVRVEFGKSICGLQRKATLRDKAEFYLDTMMKNGQLCGEQVIGWHKNCLIAYGYATRSDSFQPCYYSGYAREQHKILHELFGRDPHWTLLDDSAPKRFPSLKSADTLYLFTNMFDNISPPVRHGKTGVPVPQYLLPLDDDQRERVFFWACDYRSHDRVWLYSGELEIPAYKQMVDPTSSLSEWGRTLCRSIEEATGLPTYYFLQRYWGRRTGEAERTCPLCGGKWLVPNRPEQTRAFHQFAFRCKRCRLVSHDADSYEDERHARIGEYRDGAVKKR